MKTTWHLELPKHQYLQFSSRYQNALFSFNIRFILLPYKALVAIFRQTYFRISFMGMPHSQITFINIHIFVQCDFQ